MPDIRLDELLDRLDKRNLNSGTQRGSALIKASIRRDGFARPVFAAADGTILGGNHAIKAVHELAESGEEIGEPIVVHSRGNQPIIHVRDDIPTATDPKAVRLKISDNRASALNTSIDLLAMKQQMEEADILPEEVGYAVEEIEVRDIPAEGVGGESTGLPEGGENVQPDPEEDRVPESVPQRCKAGDIWEIRGKSHVHKLLVGDCRDLIGVQRLFGLAKANLVCCSPPYASQRTYVEGSGFEPIPADQYVAYFESVQACVGYFLAPNGNFFINIRAHCEDGERHLYVYDLVCAMKRKWGWRFIDDMVWRRKAPPGSWPGRLRSDWEPVFHFSNGKPEVNHDAIRYRIEDVHGRGAEADPMASHWNRPAESDLEWALPGNVIDAGVEGHKTGHQAVYPVKLPLFLIKAFSMRPDDIIYDPYTGSGTTLIAAERAGRRFFGCELAARYADGILARCEQNEMTVAKVDEVQL